jgi:Rod binding domain-containing protein
MAVGSIGGGFIAPPDIKSNKDAANAFEAMLFKQLLKSMTNSVQKSGLFGSGFQADMYSDMYTSVIAEEAAGSGMGISAMLQESFGGDGNSAGSISHVLRRSSGSAVYRKMIASANAIPSNANLKVIADNWLKGDAASRWSKDGELTRTDLNADIETTLSNGVARFNVQDADGYKGYPKCNLFAFEMVRRFGSSVPVIARKHGWGYPGADAVAHMAQKGAVEKWASVKTSDSAGALDAIARSGQPLLLTSAADGDAVGHMAVADRIHAVKHDKDGNIEVLEYSGWEATGHGATYGTRVWRLKGIKGPGRGGLNQIEILVAKKADGLENAYVPVNNRTPGVSIQDSISVSRAEYPQGLFNKTDNNQWRR